ncbi:family 78 glycoside hydrolase catalytic domain [Demequina sp.]|uniref:family 78 glycoside hydrolase catalytic domain n=1 Tax=Demequina sp. TaxID=2050685 RepID=UPI0025D535B6|nr:family 78 glycoside hydrolase catalytic domain [Demequina sp.]
MSLAPDDARLLADATFITIDAPEGVAPTLSTSVPLDQPASQVTSAMLVATAHGVYEPVINGEPATASVLNPGWTSYEWRLQVQRFDVTGLVAGGDDAVALDVRLGNGWYRGKMGFDDANIDYGSEIGLLAALEVTFADGATQRIVTSPAWTARASDTTENTFYQGQSVDARLRGAGAELPVREGEFDRSRLLPQVGPLIMRQEVLRPVRIWTSPAGRTLVDFGQNLVGWLRFTIAGEAGTEIVIRHAEVLENHELGTRPLRAAASTDTFVLSGGEDFFEPTLTFHGFRYAEITGWPGELTADSIEAVVVHSQMRATSEFECSEPLVNQLISNSIWGQKGNFLDVPTDCPQRDERLGWTGDIAAFAATAAFQFDTADFLHKWLLDLAEETRHAKLGSVPFVVPDPLKYASGGVFDMFPPLPTAIWGDASVWVPQALWNAYGDKDRLAAHYPAMVLHLEGVEKRLSPTGLWEEKFQFGDWLDPDAPPEAPFNAKADNSVVATACLYRSASFAAEAASILGRPDDAARWAALASQTRAAFNEHYVSADGIITSDCTTVYALAICFGLLDQADQAAGAARLAELVRERGHIITTGFAGTPFVTWALSENGYLEDAYRLLLQTNCPSWLYAVTMGATTIWERWDSMLPDGSINPGEMTSFNHYALGAVADWIYQVVAGIQAASPGYATIRIAPQPGPGLDWVRCAHESPVGRIAVSWRVEDGVFALDIDTPVGVPVEVVLPDGAVHSVDGGAHTFTAAA